MKQLEKPNIFTYHDHISFLKDWFLYLKKSRSEFSMRTLAQKSQIASGYLPMVLAGQRELSEKAFLKILPNLGLDTQERKFLSLLRLVGESRDPSIRVDAVNQMSKLRRFQESNNKEVRVYEYLTKWFYVAIRELVALSDFKMDSEWIKNKLTGRITISEIEEAIEFLKVEGFLAQDPNGKWVQPKADLDCREGIFKLSLGQFHRQMFDLASESIEKTPREKRYILGHTVAISAQDFEKIKAILNESVDKILQMKKEDAKKEHVYHIEMAAFPLTLDERK